MDPVTGQLLASIGSTLLGGLFGKKKQTTTSYVDYGRMVRDSSAAGFNPLTALQNGGSQGFAVTETPTLATQNALASALGAGVETLFNKDQIRGDAEMRKLDLEIRREELKNLRTAGSVLFEKSPFGPTHVSEYGVRDANSNQSTPSLAAVRGTGGDFDPKSLTPPEMDTFNLYVKVYDPQTERWTTIPNPDLMDAGPLEVATGLSMIGAADAAQNGKKKVKSNSPFMPSSGYKSKYSLPELAPHAAQDSFYEPWPW